MSEVKIAAVNQRSPGPRVFRNVFSNKAFREEFNALRADRGPDDQYVLYLQNNQSKTIIPLLDLDKEVLGFLCFQAPCTNLPRPGDTADNYVTKLHSRWLEVLGQLCSRVLEIRERHQQSVVMSDQLYAQMASKQAMAEFGEMSAAITHEIKHYFQRLLNLAELALVEIEVAKPNRDPRGRVKEIIKEILEGSERLTTLNDLFKDMSQKGKGAVSVADAIAKALDLMATSVQEANVKCIVQIPSDLPLLPMGLDHSLLVFTNLIRNACDAIREVSRKSGRIVFKAAWERPKLTVTVTDNGCGIAQENLLRLFQIGFTTKRKSRGMGVGLSLVRRILQEHLGTISAASSFGEGATFQIEFTLRST